jgi:Transglutaminase-like superfamily
MCLATSNVQSAVQWNWEGDLIVHNPIIPASRKIPGMRKKYEIDIREYLANRDNAVIKRALDEIVNALCDSDRALFFSHKDGAFDFRMRKVTDYISKRVTYEKSSRTFDSWLFPEETLAKGRGDCEDRAFLLASMLLSSGISGYVVRVALGKLYNQNTKQSRDHIWVMYKNESGLWMLIEPLLHSERARRQGKALREKAMRATTDTYEYVPYFVFNDSHLWSLKNNTVETTFLDYLKSRRFWEEFDPEFAATVHNHIFDLALDKLNWSDLLYVKGVSMAMDINPATYDPRDHFDNGYIAESWQQLNQNLMKKTLDGLARASHSIGDFYAHSSYAHFAKRTAGGDLVPFDGIITDDHFARIPDYGSADFDLRDTARFSMNTGMCTMTKDEAIAYWTSQKIFSGRFAQPRDPYQGFLEKLFISIPYQLRHREDFMQRTCLPHHNEIAVDRDLDSNGNIPDGHTLYLDPKEYSDQFRIRRDAAVSHIKKLYSVLCI